MAAFLAVVASLLILLTPLSYLPLCNSQFSRSTNGISLTAAMLLALCAQAQLPTMYYLWYCPPSKRYGLVVPKPALLIDKINLVQIFVQWICSLFYLTFLLAIRARETAEPPTATMSRKGPSTRTAAAVILGHACLCAFWALLAGSPTDDWLDLPFVTIMSINQEFINPLITTGYMLAFLLQMITVQETVSPSSLNRTFLSTQIIVFLALAISWPFRFQVPLNLHGPNGNGLWWLEEWYPLVGWTCVNSAVVSIGQGFVLYFFVTTKERGSEDEEEVGERQALLNT